MRAHDTTMRVSLRLAARRQLSRGIAAMVLALAATGAGSVASAAPAPQSAATPTATSTTTCVTPSQGIAVLISAPNPGDVITPGLNVTVSGIAYDTGATTDPGIDRVSVYFGDRDAGGLFWGTAALGQPNPLASSGPQSTAGFSLRSPTIPSGSGGRDIFVYAHSSITGKEGIASVPVFLGAAPTPARGGVPTPVLQPTAAPAICTPVPAASPTPTSTSTPVPAAAAPTTPPTPTSRPTVAAPVVAPPIPQPVATSAPVAAPAAAPAAVAPTTATTAPRGGGLPIGVGLALLGVGGLIVGGGYLARRREQRPRHHRD